MRCTRPVIAADPALFGRRRTPVRQREQELLSTEDVRLFLTTFAAGFVFVAVLIA